MQRQLLTAILALTVASTASAKTRNIPVPSDPKATCKVLNITRKPGGLVEITTERQGPSGTSYTRRLVNCTSQTFKYTGDADTLEGLNQINAADPMGELVPGSISYYISRI